jgi:hypothetical protein
MLGRCEHNNELSGSIKEDKSLTNWAIIEVSRTDLLNAIIPFSWSEVGQVPWYFGRKWLC